MDRNREREGGHSGGSATEIFDSGEGEGKERTGLAGSSSLLLESLSLLSSLGGGGGGAATAFLDFFSFLSALGATTTGAAAGSSSDESDESSESEVTSLERGLGPFLVDLPTTAGAALEEDDLLFFDEDAFSILGALEGFTALTVVLFPIVIEVLRWRMEVLREKKPTQKMSGSPSELGPLSPLRRCRRFFFSSPFSFSKASTIWSSSARHM